MAPLLRVYGIGQIYEARIDACEVSTDFGYAGVVQWTPSVGHPYLRVYAYDGRDDALAALKDNVDAGVKLHTFYLGDEHHYAPRPEEEDAACRLLAAYDSQDDACRLGRKMSEAFGFAWVIRAESARADEQADTPLLQEGPHSCYNVYVGNYAESRPALRERGVTTYHLGKQI